jgi:hypothetical protein
MSLAPEVSASIRIRSTKLTIGEAFALAAVVLISRSSISAISWRSPSDALGMSRSWVRDRGVLVVAVGLGWEGGRREIREMYHTL